MKKFLMITLALIFSTNAFAKINHFKCTAEDVSGVHKFDAVGVFSVEVNNQVEGFMNLIVQKAQADQSIQTFNDIRISGYLREFNAGDVSKDDFVQLVLTSDNVYIKSLNLLLNLVEQKNASIVASIDNFTFRSNCKIVEE